MYIHKLITVAAHFFDSFCLLVLLYFFNTGGEDSHLYSTNSLILSVLTLIIFFYKLIYSERW